MRQQFASKYLSVDDSVAVLGLGTKLKMRPFVLDIKGRAIGAESAGLRVIPTDPAYLDIDPPQRYFKWSQRSSRETNFQSVSDIEKAYLLFQRGKFELSVGRRAVGIGTLKYLPIWNRFLPGVGHIGGPSLIHNPDDIQMSYQFKKLATSALHIHELNPEENISILLATWYLTSFEVHVFGGDWKKRNTAGIAFVKDISGLTLRGEGFFFRTEAEPKVVQQQVGLGIEYAFSPRFSFVMEAMYSSIGAERKSEYLSSALSGSPDRMAILNANGYFFGTVEFLPHDFWKVSLGSLVNLVDSSMLAIGEIKHYWSDNLELSFQAKQPIAEEDEEFGSNFYRVSNRANFGYSQQLAAQLNYYF